MYKLINMHFRDYLIRLTTSSFLQNLGPISGFGGEDDFRHLLEIKTGVPQGLVLLVLCTYALYIKDIPTYAREHAALSADGTVLFPFDANTDMVTLNLQQALINLQTCYFFQIFIVAPCILKNHLVSHTNECTSISYI